MLIKNIFCRGTIVPLLFALWFQSQSVIAQSVSIQGYILDSLNGEFLIGATLIDTLSKKGTYTNEVGFFSMQISIGATIEVNYIGYSPKLVKIKEIPISKELKIKMTPTTSVIDGVEIRARNHKYEINKIYFTQNSLNSTVILGGEKDILKSITLTPGIKSGVEGTSNIYVRGGNGDQNLFLIEGIPMYNIAHLYGLVSIFPGDQVQSVSAYKGSFPAKYGGRLSSVIDIRLKNGNDSRVEKSVSLGTLSTKANINGAIFKKRLKYNLFYRRNLFDVYNNLFGENSKNNGFNKEALYFSDFYAKLTYNIVKSHYLQFFTFDTNDSWKRYSKSSLNMEYRENIENLNWGNQVYQLRFYGSLGSKGSYDFNVFTSGYNAKFGIYMHENTNTTDFRSDYKYENSIKEYCSKLDIKYAVFPNLTLNTGFEIKNQFFLPGQVSLNQSINGKLAMDTMSTNNQYRFMDCRWYISNEYKIDKWIFQGGINANSNRFLPAGIVLEPRLLAFYNLRNGFDIHTSIARTSQNIHQFSNSALGLPTDIWISSNEIIPVSFSDNFALGGSWETEKLTFSMDAYYRKMKGLLQYRPGAGFLLTGDDWYKKILTSGKGYAYGIELLLKKQAGQITGWISYTFSRSFRVFPSINEGKLFNFQFDRPHELDCVLSYRINKKWDFSLNWKFASGNPVNIPVGSIPSIYFDNLNYDKNLGGSGISNDLFEIPSFDNNSVDRNSIYIYDGYNNYRLPHYHRLDLSVNRTIQMKKLEMIINLSVYNLYNRKNPLYAYMGFKKQVYHPTNPNTNSKADLHTFYQFPILPSITLTVNF